MQEYIKIPTNKPSLTSLEEKIRKKYLVIEIFIEGNQYYNFFLIALVYH